MELYHTALYALLWLAVLMVIVLIIASVKPGWFPWLCRFLPHYEQFTEEITYFGNRLAPFVHYEGNMRCKRCGCRGLLNPSSYQIQWEDGRVN